MYADGTRRMGRRVMANKPHNMLFVADKQLHKVDLTRFHGQFELLH